MVTLDKMVEFGMTLADGMTLEQKIVMFQSLIADDPPTDVLKVFQTKFGLRDDQVAEFVEKTRERAREELARLYN